MHRRALDDAKFSFMHAYVIISVQKFNISDLKVTGSSVCLNFILYVWLATLCMWYVWLLHNAIMHTKLRVYIQHSRVPL